jgi:hypothetical protein
VLRYLLVATGNNQRLHDLIKRFSVTDITERMTGLSEYGCKEKGEIIMKMLLAGVAFAIGVAFASQAFALPYCTWQHGHYVCGDYDL